MVMLEMINKLEENENFYQMDSLDDLMEFMWLRPERTHLNVDIFVDDGGSYIRHNHCLLLFVRNGYERTCCEFIPFRVSESPVILDDAIELKISDDDVLKVRDFIVANIKKLEDLADRKISQIEFVSRLVVPEKNLHVSF